MVCPRLDRSGTTTSAQEWLLDNELLVRQTIVTSGVWLVFIGFGAYLNIGPPFIYC